jgi:iron complex outermembrane receptor protein
MGGAINLVTRKPAKPFEFEASGSLGGRSSNEGWNGYVMAGTRQQKFYLQGSANFADRDYWTLSDKYQPTANSLQREGRRQSSDSADSRLNFKGGFTPNTTDEYTVNFIQQSGEKGAPINIYNNPPSPPNSYWRWPYWDIQNTSLLTRTQLGKNAYVKGKRITTSSRMASMHLTMRPTRLSRRMAASAVPTTTTPTAAASKSAPAGRTSTR